MVPDLPERAYTGTDRKVRVKCGRGWKRVGQGQYYISKSLNFDDSIKGGVLEMCTTLETTLC